MKVIYEFTKKEKDLINELKAKGNTFNFSPENDNLRSKYKKEISTFIDEGILYHSNRGQDGAYIRYSVSEKALKIIGK